MTRKPPKRPKRLKVTVERSAPGGIGFVFGVKDRTEWVLWTNLRRMGVPVLRPGESCKGWLSFEEEK